MKPVAFVLISTAAWMFASFVHAAPGTPFDGKKSLVCTIQQLFECNSFAGCRTVAEDVAFPIRHLNIDVDHHTITIEHLQTGLSSPIARTEVVDGKLVLQGTDSGLNDEIDGGGYTMTINQRYGTMILSIAAEDAAFVGTGACIARN